MSEIGHNVVYERLKCKCLNKINIHKIYKTNFVFKSSGQDLTVRLSLTKLNYLKRLRSACLVIIENIETRS